MQTSFKRTFTCLATVAAASLSVGACRQDARREAGQATPDKASLRVALLTPGPISDQSWNGGAYQGLLRIRDSLGAQVSHVQTATPADFEENFRQYGAQGYDLVFGHGFEFQDAARRVAPSYPRTAYVITSGASAEGNVSSILFDLAGPSYLAGLAAGRMSRSGIVGVIGGTELPPVKESFDAFARGAREANPQIRLLTSYIGNWDDVSAGKEQALAQIARGADVIFQNADAAGLGVFQAARESKKALIVGSNSDQNSVAPEVTIGSVVIDLPHAFLTIARDLTNHTFKPGLIHLGPTTDVVRFVWNPALVDRIPADLRQRVDSLAGDMRAGKSPASVAAP